MRMSSTTLGRAALGGAGSTVFWQLIRVIILGLSIVILARLLDPADFGLMAMAMALIGVGEILRDGGLLVASVQARTLNKSEQSNLFWMNVAIGIALTAVAFSLATPIAKLYQEPALVEIVQFLSFTFLINGVATQFKAQINRDLRFMVLGATEAGAQALGLAVAVWWAISIGGYGALIVQALVVAMSALLLNVASARWRPGRIDRRVSVKRFLRFGGALAGTQSIAYASKNIDTLLLGITVSSTQLGFYNRAYQIVSLPMTQLTAPMSRVAIPILSRTQDQEQTFLRYIRAGQFFSVATVSLLYGIAIGLAVPLVTLVLGKEWLGAAPLIQALAVSGVFRAMGQVPYWLFVSRGYAGAQFRFYMVAQPVIILCIFAGLPYGPLGVAIGVSVGYALFWCAQMFWAQRKCGIETGGLALSALKIVVLICAPVAALSFFVGNFIDGAVLAILGGSSAAILYGLVIVFAVPGFRTETLAAVRLAKKRKG